MRRSYQGRLELALEALDGEICLWMVAGGSVAEETDERHDSVPNSGLKMTATVRGESERHAES